MLKGNPIMIARHGIGSWIFLNSQFVYTDIRSGPTPSAFAPFLAEPKAGPAGLFVERALHRSNPMGKTGRPASRRCGSIRSYGSLIQTSDNLTHENPALVQRCRPSIEGCYPLSLRESGGATH